MGSTRSWSLRLRIALSMATAPQSFILSAPKGSIKFNIATELTAFQPATLFARINGSEAPFARGLNLTTIRCKCRWWRRRSQQTCSRRSSSTKLVGIIRRSKRCWQRWRRWRICRVLCLRARLDILHSRGCGKRRRGRNVPGRGGNEAAGIIIIAE